MRLARFSFALSTLVVVSVPATATAQRSGKGPTACALLSADDIRKITGRSDLATSAPQAEDLEAHSNCIRSGILDVGITIDGETKVMFGRMRDNYKNAPARLGYKVEPVSGVGDDAYFLMDKDRVKLIALKGEKELTIALTKNSPLPGNMPPEAEAKAMVLNLAKAGIAKLP